MSANFRTIAFPDRLLKIENGTFELVTKHIFSDTFFSTFVRAAGPVLQLWRCEVSLVPMERQDHQEDGRGGWQELQSFRARLGGQVVLFEMTPPVQALPLGAGAGYAPTNDAYEITGVSITGTSLVQGSVSGLVSEAAPRYATSLIAYFHEDVAGEVVLRHGDLFGLGGNMHICVANVTADEDGIARIPFRAPLWKGAKEGDLLDFYKPTCRMQLSAPGEGSVSLSAPEIGRGGFSAVEVPYA